MPTADSRHPTTTPSSLPARKEDVVAPVVRQTFVPPVPMQPHGPLQHDARHYRRRIAWLTILSAALAGVVWVSMTDPFGWGHTVEFGWRGLLVYASTVALLLFLCVLLVRYFGVLVLSYVYNAKYTAQEAAYVREEAYAREEASGADVEADPQALARAFLPPVSIIVPAYNEDVLIERTILSLIEQDYPRFEVIVVDDGSRDRTNTLAEQRVGVYENSHGGRAEVRLVSKPNGGKATALNAGIAVSQHDFVLCVDGDSQLSPETLRRAIRHLRDPEIGAVAGNVKVKNRDTLWTKLQALEYIEGLNMVRAAQSAVRLVNIIPGPVGLFRKAAIVEAGWYASDTFAEDCDITLQILRAGWRVVYEPGAVSWTEAPNRLTDLLKQRYRWTRGILQAIRKHRDLVFNPTVNFGGTLVLWSMAFESLIWPAMNVFAHLFFVAAAVVGYSQYLVFWWLSLTILDLAAALYCVATEREDLRLVPLTVIYRLFFVLTIDVCKCAATVEELLGFGMGWGKLKRIGG
ncbi:MAG: glycosyltransferase family 2 protein [Bacteroidota bacterium]